MTLDNSDVDDVDDLMDWDLDFEGVDFDLSVSKRQQLFRKRIAHWVVD